LRGGNETEHQRQRAEDHNARRWGPELDIVAVRREKGTKREKGVEEGEASKALTKA
jgi:hypothetical protein